jgi:hypothetical protein
MYIPLPLLPRGDTVHMRRVEQGEHLLVVGHRRRRDDSACLEQLAHDLGVIVPDSKDDWGAAG